jgi:hypothetical protein
MAIKSCLDCHDISYLEGSDEEEWYQAEVQSINLLEDNIYEVITLRKDIGDKWEIDITLDNIECVLMWVPKVRDWDD